MSETPWNALSEEADRTLERLLEAHERAINSAKELGYALEEYHREDY